MGRAANILRGQEHDWRGEAAECFRERAAVSAPAQLEQAELSFLAAGSALTAWADVLEDHQRQAVGLDQQAADLARRITVLRNDAFMISDQVFGANLASGPPQAPPGGAASHAELFRQAARADVRLSSARAEEEQVHVAAARLRDLTLEAAGRAAGELAAAKEMAPLSPALWRQGLSFVGDVVSDTVMPFWDLGVGTYHLVTDPKEFLRDHQEALRLISEVTGILSSVMGILALVPLPAFQVLALPALILGGLSTLSAYGAEVGAKNSWSEGYSGSVKLGLATTLLGVGALGAATKLGSAAKGGNFMRTGVTIGGRTLGKGESPVGFFGVMQRSGQGMEQAEFGWRVAQVQVNPASLATQGLTIRDGAPAWGDRMGEFAHGRAGMISR